MRLAWLSDIHLNFLNSRELRKFLGSILYRSPDAVAICGDIGEADCVTLFLEVLESQLARPIYFVLGNHDFYVGSVAAVRSAIEDLCRDSRYLSWLPRAGVVELTGETAVVGHDGWADGRYGDYENSEALLNDYFCISELTGLDKHDRLKAMQRLAAESAEHFRRLLPEAFERFRHVFLLTHVPPFSQACSHQGRACDDEWLPHYSSKAAGDVLLEVMRARPDRRLTVLCGHTHGQGRAEILPNLIALTARAEYGRPEVQDVFEIE